MDAVIVAAALATLGLLAASRDIYRVLRRGWRRAPTRWRAAWRLHDFRDARAASAGFDPP